MIAFLIYFVVVVICYALLLCVVRDINGHLRILDFGVGIVICVLPIFNIILVLTIIVTHYNLFDKKFFVKKQED